MRFLFSILLIVAGTGFIVYQFAPETYSCVRPIRYSIGEFDERFGLSEEEFLFALEQAENVWEEAAGEDLFTYDERGRFKVNLIYDDRQFKTDLAETSGSALDQKQREYERADRDYREKAANLDAAVREFNARVRDLERRRTRYAQDVRVWNRSSRVDVNTMNALREEEEELLSIESALQERDAEIREMQSDVGEALRIRNQLAEDYNIDVAVFNQRFGAGEAFDQGIYSRGQISIFQFTGIEDLVLVLAHEFGHALGIDHVDDPEAVMYYLMEGQAKDPVELTSADKAALAVRCPF